MKLRICAAGLVVACGSSLSLGQEEEFDAPTCVRLPSGSWSIINTRADAVNLCPSVAVTGGPDDLNRMIFAWGGGTLQFHGGVVFGLANVPASPAQGDLPAQVFARRFDASGAAIDAQPRAMVFYSSGSAWGHRYPCLAAQRFAPGEPEPPAEA